MADGDIDPKRLDVATAPRRRRVRAKPEPGATLQAEKPKALSRARRRPIPPGIMFDHGGGDSYEAAAPHSDHDLWELQIADAFGTRSASAMRSFLDHLRALCATGWDDPNKAWKPNEQEVSAALSFVASVKPQNEAEAALAAQMLAVHWMQMRLSAQALNNGNMVMAEDAALAGKLARTYVQQLQAFREVQGKRRSTRQTIKVSRENHIHYHDHRGDKENDIQLHGTAARAIGERPALQGEEPGGQVLRLPSRPRPRRV